MTEHENDSVERALISMAPQPLGVSNGSVMFEAGKAVGRVEALAERQSRIKSTLAIWQLAMAASLALTLLSFSGWLNSATATPTSISEKSPTSSDEELTSSAKEFTSAEKTNPQTLRPRSPWIRSISTGSAGQQTMIGIRNRLLSSAPNADFDDPKPLMIFPTMPSPTAFNLLRQYTDSGAL